MAGLARFPSQRTPGPDVLDPCSARIASSSHDCFQQLIVLLLTTMCLSIVNWTLHPANYGLRDVQSGRVASSFTDMEIKNLRLYYFLSLPALTVRFVGVYLVVSMYMRNKWGNAQRRCTIPMIVICDASLLIANAVIHTRGTPRIRIFVLPRMLLRCTTLISMQMRARPSQEGDMVD